VITTAVIKKEIKMTKNEKEEMLKQVLANAGYDYEPKTSKDGDETWTPCGQDISKEE
jgi:hypothetical protein